MIRPQGLNVVAVDGMRENIERSHFPAAQIDLTKVAVNTRAAPSVRSESSGRTGSYAN
jgi:hypothetical protein